MPCSLREPDFHNFSSLARDSRISACAKDSRAFLDPSSTATTRYSISSPHSNASRSFPFARRQLASNCCPASTKLIHASRSNRRGGYYLNTPFAHLAGLLLRFRPFQSRSEFSCRPLVYRTRDIRNWLNTYSRPMISCPAQGSVICGQGIVRARKRQDCPRRIYPRGKDSSEASTRLLCLVRGSAGGAVKVSLGAISKQRIM